MDYEFQGYGTISLEENTVQVKFDLNDSINTLFSLYPPFDFGLDEISINILKRSAKSSEILEIDSIENQKISIYSMSVTMRLFTENKTNMKICGAAKFIPSNKK